MTSRELARGWIPLRASCSGADGLPHGHIALREARHLPLHVTATGVGAFLPECLHHAAAECRREYHTGLRCRTQQAANRTGAVLFGNLPAPASPSRLGRLHPNRITRRRRFAEDRREVEASRSRCAGY